MTRHVVVAMMKHETNTFSPVPTPLARFARGHGSPPRGEAAIRAMRGTGSALAGFIDSAEAAGARVSCPLAADAWPSGPVEDAAYAEMVDAIREAVKAGPDAVMLDLHGAMVTQTREDGEGGLLTALRAVAPDVPIAVAYDMHANIYDEMVRTCQVVAGYKTYPHVDVYDTGRKAGDVLMRALAGELRPVTLWGNRPMLPHVMRQGTDDGPNRELQAMAARMQEDGRALTANVFTGFPHADIGNAGLSAVVTVDGAAAAGEPLCRELLEAAWDRRADFVYRPEPLADSLARAAQHREGPVILLDHYDNAASGGTMDRIDVLAGILDAGLEDVAAFAIHDPDAVQAMIQAGPGAEVTLDLGAHIPIPSIDLDNRPLKVTGRVKALTDGSFVNRGPMSAGVRMDMGPSAVLDTGKVEIAVISRHQEPNDVGALMSLGIDPTRKRYLMLKSRVHFRAGFKTLAKEIVECAGTGVCTSDYGQLTFRNVRRPVYPLDDAVAPTSTGPAG